MQTKHHVAADHMVLSLSLDRPQTTLRPSQLTWTVSPPEMAATIRIHFCHLLLLSTKYDAHLPSHEG